MAMIMYIAVLDVVMIYKNSAKHHLLLNLS